MAKRKRSQDENLQPQYKTYVSDKIQQQNNATKMRVIYDKTTSMLFNGVKNLSKIENNNNQEKNVNNKNNPETKTSLPYCDDNALWKCYFCDKNKCAECIVQCNKCENLYCKTCSIIVYDQPDISHLCLSCV
ncbi:uncharacterized protein LOC113371628 [Ctenocephalides felis]|uniref:uncharacterized protein LOC113371628 n=1 Tax=Ctenocephalides felis TaxID=7515 RepID=UPI000E6E2BA9|nr:uncharacterized protein LOC113371628 [Ctenocephalides felis]